jgi:hypothetical protein
MRELILVPVLAVSSVLWASDAVGQIYRCENGNGVIEYSNTPGSSRDRNCRAVDLPAITTIPAPKLPKAAQPSAKASPESFPKVDNGTQKARDSDRRRILEDELRKEEAKLAELRQEYNAGEPERRGDERNYQRYLDRVQRLKEDIDRSEGNIGSLKRELGSVKD